MSDGNLRMVVLGDSVAWGQGLEEPEKFYSLVQTEIGAGSCAVLAHSGATIGVDVTREEDPVNGEVPVPYPTILQQCDRFTDSPETTDLVLVNGSINDIDIRFILNPFTHTLDLQDEIELNCYRGMKVLLQQVTAKFNRSATKIVVTSYYPILSEQSDFPLLNIFLSIHGVSITAFFDVVDRSLVLNKIVQHCSLFWDQSTQMIRRAVDEINQEAGGTPRVFFAIPSFTAANSALAPDAWLFGINWDLSAQDPVAATRHHACDTYERDPIRRQTCYRASAGHPNPTGAQQYAQAIMAVL